MRIGVCVCVCVCECVAHADRCARVCVLRMRIGVCHVEETCSNVLCIHALRGRETCRMRLFFGESQGFGRVWIE